MEEQLTEEILHKKTPEELTALLYSACIKSLEQSKVEINNRNYHNANLLLIKANDILYRLGAGINYESGPISDQLEMLYNYIAEKVIQANLQKSVLLIDEVLIVLKMITDAWNAAINKRKEDTYGNMKIKNKVSAYDLLYPNTHSDINLKK